MYSGSSPIDIRLLPSDVFPMLAFPRISVTDSSHLSDFCGHVKKLSNANTKVKQLQTLLTNLILKDLRNNHWNVVLCTSLKIPKKKKKKTCWIME